MLTRKLKNDLIRIAHSYNVKCRFRKDVAISSVDIFTDNIVISDFMPHLSDFFHELGHIVDYRNGIYKGYYYKYPTKKYLKRFAVRAEMHTDLTGYKLMKLYFPNYKYEYTYKYKKWQKWLKKYWDID